MIERTIPSYFAPNEKGEWSVLVYTVEETEPGTYAYKRREVPGDPLTTPEGFRSALP